MQSKAAAPFVKKIYHDIWQGNNLDKFSHYYHSDVLAYMDEQIINYQDLQTHALWQKENIKDLTFYFKDIIATEEKIAFQYYASGSKNQQTYNWHVLAIYHLKANKIHRCWALSYPKIEMHKN